MTQNQAKVVFSRENRKWLLAILAVVIPTLIGVMVIGRTEGWVGALFAVIVGITSVVIFAWSIKPVAHPVMQLTDEGVLVYEHGHKLPRLLHWSHLTGVDVEVFKGAKGGSVEYMVFNIKGLRWKVLLKSGASPTDEILSAIRSRIRPDESATLDADAFFRTIFSIQLPPTARILRSEWHQDDTTGIWSVRIPKDEFLKLRTTSGIVSDWYPLTRDQRFEVGGRRFVGTSDLHGEYAISEQDWDSTPVLVWDASEETLHGLLTRSVM